MRYRSTGFTVVELLVAIGLGLLIVAGISRVYLSNRNTYMIEEALARLQESGRFANFILGKDLRMAGFVGCTNQKQIYFTNQISSPSYTKDFSNHNNTRGYDSPSSTFSPALPANLSGKALPGSDVIEVRMASPISVYLSNNMLQSNNPIPVTSNMGIQAGEALIITDCNIGDLFIATSNAGTTITHTTASNVKDGLSAPYALNSQVYRYIYAAYYVKDTGRVNNSGQPVLALVKQDMNGAETEIAEGVEKIRVLYGIDTDGDNSVNAYQTATQVQNSNNWRNVMSIQINMLLSTVEGVSDRAQTYTFNGTTTTATDKRLYKEWDTFVNIRNRGL